MANTFTKSEQLRAEWMEMAFDVKLLNEADQRMMFKQHNLDFRFL